MIVKVTQEDIDKANKIRAVSPILLPTICPVFQALARMGLNPLGVAGTYCRLSGHASVDLPRNATQWIKAWDEGESVQPFEFSLELESERSQSL